MQTAANQNDLIIKEIRIPKEEIGNVMVEVENTRDQVDTVRVEVENVKVEVKNVKLEVENVKLEVKNVKVEMENVKVEMNDFKNQVSADMSKLVKALEKIEVLLKKTPDPYSCIHCSMGSFCLDGKPVGSFPLIKTKVRAIANLNGGIVKAADTGIGYYKDKNYAVIWEEAGDQLHYDYRNMVYTCGANRQ